MAVNESVSISDGAQSTSNSEEIKDIPSTSTVIDGLVETSEPSATAKSDETAGQSEVAEKNDAPISTESEIILSEEELAEARAESGQLSPIFARIVNNYGKLQHQLLEVKQKFDSQSDKFLRQQADYENARKRMQRDLDNTRKFALERFATELLPVKDSMELGLEAAAKPETELDAICEGMGLTLKMLSDLLEKFGIVAIDPQNEKFDPQWHEAMAMQPVPGVEEGQVIHVHQKGYKLNERLLRPARVLVAKAVESVQAEESFEN